MLRKKCLMCNSLKLNDIINLGMHPFADTFIPKSKIHLSEKVHPLIVQLCKSCKNIQLKCQTKPEERYQDYEYSYTSSNSNFAHIFSPFIPLSSGLYRGFGSVKVSKGFTE